MKKEISNRQFFFIISTILMVLILLPIFIIAFYNHPSADDYSYAIDTYHAVQNHSNIFQIIATAFKTTIKFYNTWQGLYSSAFVLSLQPAIFGEQFYALTTFIIAGIVYLGLLLFFKSIYKYIFKSTKKTYYYVSFLILFFMLEMIPSPVEGLYWFNGSVNYLFFFGLLLIQIGYLIKYNFTNKKLVLIPTTILAFILSGGNHITAFACLLINIFLSIVFIILNKNKDKIKNILFIIPILASLIGFIINLMAPGTAIRAACFGHPTVMQTLVHTTPESFYFIFNQARIPMLLLVFAVVLLMKDELKNVKVNLVSVISFVIFSYILVAGLLCVPYKAMGNYGAMRLVNTLYFIITMLLITIGTLTYSYFATNYTKNNNKSYPILTYIFIVFFIVLVGFFGKKTTTTLESIHELREKTPQSYSNEINERLKIYTNPEIEDAEIPSLTVHPGILFFDDITAEKEDWRNTAISEYYNKKSMVIKNN